METATSSLLSPTMSGETETTIFLLKGKYQNTQFGELRRTIPTDYLEYLERNVKAKRVKWTAEERENVEQFLHYMEMVKNQIAIAITVATAPATVNTSVVEIPADPASIEMIAEVAETEPVVIELIDEMEPIDKIEIVYHMADIHIRIYERHEEYQAVFDQFYQYLDNKTKEEQRKSIIVLAGDILHSKSHLSPSCIIFTSRFFKELTKRVRAVIIIPGNHDINVTNPSKDDSLTSIIYDKENSFGNLYYWKESRIQEMGDLVFGYSSIVDNVFITAEDVNEFILRKYGPSGLRNKTKIALFHGGVSSPYATWDRPSHVVSDFNGYDYTMLGDIHQFQYLDDRKTIAYPSSTIQQNYGETVENHGFIEWNIKERTSKHVHIHNDYSFYTLNVINDKLYNPADKRWYKIADVSNKEIFKFQTGSESQNATNPRIRVFYHQTMEIDLSMLEQYLRMRDDITLTEFLTVYISTAEQIYKHTSPNCEAVLPIAGLPARLPGQNAVLPAESGMCENVKQFDDNAGEVRVLEELGENNRKVLEEVREVGGVEEVEEKVITKEELIREYLGDQILTDREWNKIMEIHHDIEKQWITDNQGKEKKQGNHKFRIMRLEFSNLFRYDENNIIDFRKYRENQSIGIFGNNYIGKSSIFDIILYTLFEKFSRGSTRDILNINKDWFETKIVIEVNKRYFLIERRGEISKTGSIQVNLFFYEIHRNNQLQILNGINKLETAKLIENYVGSYDDFLLISMMIQKEISVLDYTQAKKKEFFHHLFQLDEYQEYHGIAKGRFNETIKIEYKQIEKKLQSYNLASYEHAIKKITDDIAHLQNEYDIKEKQNRLDDQHVSELQRTLYQTEKIADQDWSTIEECVKELETEFENENTTRLEDDQWYIEKARLLQKVAEPLQKLKQMKEMYKQKIQSMGDILEEEKKKSYFESREMEELGQSIHTILQMIAENNAAAIANKKKSNSIEAFLEEWRPIHQNMGEWIERVGTYLGNRRRMREDVENNDQMEEWKQISQEIEQEMDKKNRKERQIREIQMQIDRITEKIGKSREYKKQLTNHRYNPECVYCCENPFVKMAQDAINEIPHLEEEKNKKEEEKQEEERKRYRIQKNIEEKKKQKETVQRLMDERRGRIQKMKQEEEVIKQFMEKLREWNTNYGELFIVKDNIKISLKNQEIEKELEEWRSKKERYQQYIQMRDLFNKYLTNKKIWEHNQRIEEEISKIRKVLEVRRGEERRTYEQICKLRVELERNEQYILQYKRDYDQYQEKKMELEIYNLYMKSMDRDGIPLMLLRKLIPQMQQLMNDFMKGFVRFQIEIEIKDMDLEFRIHRNHMNDQSETRDYNILLLSGFERFITQISLRLAMYQLGMLPRCGMFFVDEGINCFDKENITKVSSLFEQILYRYQAFLLITHLEQVKDSIHHFLEIQDHNTYSHIEIQ